MGRRKWSRESLILEIKQLHREGKELFPSSSEMKKLVSASIIHFGNWRTAVEEAGFDYNIIIRTSREKKREKQQNIARAKFINRMKELKSMGESLDASHMKRNFPELYAFAIREDTFGSWEGALVAAGLEANQVPSSRGQGERIGKAWFRRLFLERFSESGETNLTKDTLTNNFPALVPLMEKLFGSPEEFIAALKNSDRR